MTTTEMDRRSGIDRRRLSVGAYWRGALNPRRRGGRRASDAHYPIVDWHSPRLLVPVLGILALCVLDGVLTVVLMSHGASELNPVMALFVPHNLPGFAAVKLSLTGLGILILVAFSRMRLFRKVPAEVLVYVVLAGYAWLIAYELKLLQLVPSTSM